MITVACLVLASKYDELDDRIPFNANIAEYASSVAQFTEQDIIKIETEILFAFDFQLMIITPLNFVYSLAAEGFIFIDSDRIVDPTPLSTNSKEGELKGSQKKKRGSITSN